MRGITPITFSFVYSDTPDSSRRLADVYRRIFSQAWKNILDKQSTQKYTETTYEKSTDSGRVLDAGGGSEDSQGEEDHGVPDGAEGQNPSGEVRESLENKLPTS